MAHAERARRCLPFEAALKKLDEKFLVELKKSKFDDVVQWSTVLAGLPGTDVLKAEIRGMVLAHNADEEEVDR